MRQPGERQSKRRCFWEYRRARETATKKKLGGDVHWSLSWSSSTLPSTLYRREGEKTKQNKNNKININGNGVLCKNNKVLSYSCCCLQVNILAF